MQRTQNLRALPHHPEGDDDEMQIGETLTVAEMVKRKMDEAVANGAVLEIDDDDDNGSKPSKRAKLNDDGATDDTARAKIAVKTEGATTTANARVSPDKAASCRVVEEDATNQGRPRIDPIVIE